jgi:hypothetical protein
VKVLVRTTSSETDSHLGLADYISGEGANCGVFNVSEEVFHSDLLRFRLADRGGQVHEHLLSFLSPLGLDLLLCYVCVHW